MEAYVRNMVSIRITQREIELLEKSYLKKTDTFNFKVEDLHVIIDNQILETLDQIIDYLLNYFLTEGLSSNDEPNKLGLELERLNSKFIKEFQKVNDQLIQFQKARK